MFVVPMYESERGWSGKVDGYAGPFETQQLAKEYQNAYNLKYNSATSVPDYYIAAQEPIPYKNQKCDYRKTL